MMSAWMNSDEYQDMAGIFVVAVKTYRKKERRFAFVDIGNGRGWDNSFLTLWLFKTMLKFTIMILIRIARSRQPAM